MKRSRCHPITQRGSALHRIMLMLQGGPVSRADILKAGVTPEAYRHAMAKMKRHGWGDQMVMLTPAGLQALEHLGRWVYDASADRKRKTEAPQPPTLQQIAEIVRPMAGVRWP